MKKTIILILSVVITLVITSCGEIKSDGDQQQVDLVSQKVMDDINSIGEVSLEDEELINNILETYKTLTDNQKEQVENYVDLLNAQDKITQLKKEQELADTEEKEEYLSIEREYYSVIEKAITKLKSECKFPETLVIKEIIYDSFTSGSIYISYSAENELGNTVSGYYNYGVGTGVGIDGADYYDTVRQVAIGNNSKFSYKIGNNFYSQDEEIGENTRFIFIVDLEDFESK